MSPRTGLWVGAAIRDKLCSPWGTKYRPLHGIVKFPTGNSMARRFRNVVGPKVRHFRERLGLTQDQLAARLQLAGLENFDRVTVAKVESQIRSVFDFEAIVFAKVLQVESGDLMAYSPAALKTALPRLLEGA